MIFKDVIYLVIFITFILFISGCAEEPYYYDSDPEIENLAYDKYSALIDLQNKGKDLTNDAILNYNIGEYSTAISLIQKAEQSNTQLNVEIEYFKAFIKNEYENGNVKKENADFYFKQCFEFEGYLEDNHQFNIYLQKAAESAKKRNINEANRYLDLAMNSLSRGNEHIDRVNLNAEYYEYI